MRLTGARLREVLDYNPDSGIFTWKISVGSKKAGATAGCMHKATGYWLIGVDGIVYKAHTLAWLWMTNSFPVIFLDHADRKRDNNRFANLRECTWTLNAANKLVRTNKCGLKGVHQHKNGSYIAQIQINKTKKYLGSFRTARAAHLAYSEAAQDLFGEFARTS